MKDKLTKEEVLHVAHLARIKVDEDEIEKYQVELQKLLNDKYYNNINTTYYNNSSTGKAVNFNTDGTGIKNNTSRNMISEVIWKLGGWDTSQVYSNQFYSYERGETVYTGRPIIWTGKIALAYPSDYGYAADLGSCTQALNSYNNCTSVNWMKSILAGNILLTSHSSHPAGVWAVESTMNVSNASYYSYVAIGVRPVLYLASELSLSGGVGSSADPYRLSSS